MIFLTIKRDFHRFDRNLEILNKLQKISLVTVSITIVIVIVTAYMWSADTFDMHPEQKEDPVISAM